MLDCTIIRQGDSYSGRQGLDYGAGISAESAGSRGICMHRLTMEPGQRARAHMHEDHESSIYVISGRVEMWHGLPGPTAAASTVSHAQSLGRSVGIDASYNRASTSFAARSPDDTAPSM
jgi:hypothetical protein